MFLFIIICQASEDGEDSTLEPEVKLGSVDYLMGLYNMKYPKGDGDVSSIWKIICIGNFGVCSFYEAFRRTNHLMVPSKSILCSKVPKKVLLFFGHELWVRFQQ